METGGVRGEEREKECRKEDERRKSRSRGERQVYEQ